MASTTVGSIVYDATINTSGLKKDAQEADNIAEKTGSSLGKNISKGAIVAGASMVAVGATFMKVTKDSLQSTVEWATGINKLSRETGASTESISKLVYAGSRFGLQADQIGTSLGIFSKKVVEASKGNNETADTFTKLGVKVADANGKLRPFDQLFGDVAEKFRTAPNGLEKTALAMQLFGRSGKDMLPVLNQGRDGIVKLGDQAEKFGLVLTSKNVAAFAAFKKASFESEQSAKGLSIQLGLLTLGPMAKLQETATNLTEKLNGLPGPIKELIGNLIVFGGPILTASGGLIAMLGSIGTLIQVLPALGVAFTATLGPIAIGVAAVATAALVAYVVWRNWQTIMETLGPILAPLIAQFMVLWNVLMVQLAPAIQWVSNNFELLKNIALVLIGVALIPIVTAAIGITVALASVIAISAAVGFAFIQLISLGSRVISFFVNLGQQVLAATRGWRTLLVDVGSAMIEGLIQGLKNTAAGRLASAVAEIASKAKNAFKDALSIHSPSKVFEGFGQNIVQGLVNGITGNAGMVSNAMGGLTNATTLGGGLGSTSINGIVGGGAGSGGGSAVTVNVNMSGIMSRSKSDERAIATSLIKRVNETLSAKGEPVIGGGVL